METQKVLVPYNFTEIDQRALDFVVRTYGNREGGAITLLHIYVPLPKIDTESTTVMGRLTSSMHYLAGELNEKEKDLNKAKQYLLEGGFSETQVSYIFKPRSKQIADEIIEIVQNDRYDVVVLNCRPYRITRAFAQSVHNKVIASLRNVIVCIVT